MVNFLYINNEYFLVKETIIEYVNISWKSSLRNKKPCPSEWNDLVWNNSKCEMRYTAFTFSHSFWFHAVINRRCWRQRSYVKTRSTYECGSSSNHVSGEKERKYERLLVITSSSGIVLFFSSSLNLEWYIQKCWRAYPIFMLSIFC